MDSVYNLVSTCFSSCNTLFSNFVIIESYVAKRIKVMILLWSNETVQGMAVEEVRGSEGVDEGRSSGYYSIVYCGKCHRNLHSVFQMSFLSYCTEV